MGLRRMALGLPILVVLVAANPASLREGMRWDPGAVRPAGVGGPFGICHELVAASTLGRLELIREQVTILGMSAKLIPAPGSPPDVLVQLGPDGPVTLFVIHYDKSRGTPTYQGAEPTATAWPWGPGPAQGSRSGRRATHGRSGPGSCV